MTTTNRFQLMKRYREQINQLLREHPELEPLQQEIDEALKKCGNDTQKRCQVLQEMLLNNWWKITKVEL